MQLPLTTLLRKEQAAEAAVSGGAARKVSLGESLTKRNAIKRNKLRKFLKSSVFHTQSSGARGRPDVRKEFKLTSLGASRHSLQRRKQEDNGITATLLVALA